MNPAEFANIAATEKEFWWYRGMERMLWNFLEEHWESFARGRALETGCGTGWISARFAERFPECRLSSIDFASEALPYCRAQGLQRLAQADIRHLPFRPSSFQLLLSLDVIAHLAPGEEALAFTEFARLLAPGGILVVRCSAFDWLRSRHSEFVNEIQRYSKPKLLPLLQRNGFELVRDSYANTLLLPVAIAKFRIWEPLFDEAPHSGVEPVSPLLNRALGSVLSIEAAWLRRGGRFPVGQSLWLIARKT